MTPGRHAAPPAVHPRTRRATARRTLRSRASSAWRGLDDRTAGIVAEVAVVGPFVLLFVLVVIGMTVRLTE